MPVRNTGFDVLINKKGYILARAEQLGRGGRAWQVQSASTGTARLTPTETRYGAQPSTVSAPMVWRSTHLGYGAERQDIEGRYNYTENMDARFKEQVIPAPEITTLQTNMGGNVVEFFEQDDMLFAIGGQYCKEIASDDSITTAKDFSAGETATDAIVFDGSAYVGMGYSEPFWERASDADPTNGWTQATDLYMGYMSIVRQLLWASVSKNEVRDVATVPKTADNWGARYAIGDPGKGITTLTDLAELLYVGKTEGLFGLDREEGGIMLTPELRAYGGEDNCRNMIAWHGNVWVPQVRGLLRYRNMGEQGFLVTAATPGDDAGKENPVRGTVTAMAGDNRWLYAALYTNEGDTYIMAAREAQGEETNVAPLLWHPLAKIADKKCEAMHISGLTTNPRLFFGLDDDVGYIVLPRYTDNPLHDENCRYQQSGSIYYPAHTWHVPTTQKVWGIVEVEADDLVLGRYLEVYYRVDRGAWEELGRLTVSPYHKLTLPDGVIGKEIELRIDYYLPDNVSPVTLRTVLARGAERPTGVEMITATVRAASELPLRTGGHCNRTGEDIITELRALARTTETVSLITPSGDERTVLVLDPIEERESEQQGDMPREVLARVHMVTFEFEDTAEDWVFAVYGESTYGGGHVYR